MSAYLQSTHQLAKEMGAMRHVVPQGVEDGSCSAMQPYRRALQYATKHCPHAIYFHYYLVFQSENFLRTSNTYRHIPGVPPWPHEKYPGYCLQAFRFL